MFRSLVIPIASASIAAVAAASAADAATWRLDRDHTEVRFTWDHLGMSRQGGRFTGLDGTVTFDPANPAASALEVTIPVKGLMTGVKALDELLVRSGEYFQVSVSPTITFKSTAVRMTGEKTAEIDGDLAMNGIVKPVTLEARWNFTGPHPLAAINAVYANHVSSGFSAKTQVLRSEWGLARAIPYVSDEVQITIETEMHLVAGSVSPEPPPAPAEGASEAAPPAPGNAAAPETAVERSPEGHAIIRDPLAPLPEPDAGGEQLPAALEPLNRSRP